MRVGGIRWLVRRAALASLSELCSFTAIPAMNVVWCRLGIGLPKLAALYTVGGPFLTQSLC